MMEPPKLTNGEDSHSSSSGVFAAFPYDMTKLCVSHGE